MRFKDQVALLYLHHRASRGQFTQALNTANRTQQTGHSLCMMAIQPFRKYFSGESMKLFPSQEKHFTGREPNGHVVECTERKVEETSRLEFAKNRGEFRELESCGKRGAKADADRLVSSRVQSQSSFSKRFLEERIEKCCNRLRLAENLLERGRWQTNSRTFFVLKTNRLVLDGIRNTNSSKIFTGKLLVKNAIVSEL